MRAVASVLRGAGRALGPLGSTLIHKPVDPATGIVLGSWLDPEGAPQGDASTYVGP